jgi:hypothetical protein
MTAAYKLFNSPFGQSIRRAADGVFIPADPANRDYGQYLAWVAAGNTPDAADPASQFVSIDGSAWLDRLTGAEQVAVFTLARTNVQVAIFLHQLALGKDLVLRNAAGNVPPRLQAGMDRLVTAGVITAPRETELLAVP